MKCLPNVKNNSLKLSHIWNDIWLSNAKFWNFDVQLNYCTMVIALGALILLHNWVFLYQRMHNNKLPTQTIQTSAIYKPESNNTSLILFACSLHLRECSSIKMDTIILHFTKVLFRSIFHPVFCMDLLALV